MSLHLTLVSAMLRLQGMHGLMHAHTQLSVRESYCGHLQYEGSTTHMHLIQGEEWWWRPSELL